MNETLAGHLQENEDGYQFQYTSEYLSFEMSEPISLTLPMKKESYVDKNLFPFFDGLIPEGWLLNITEQNWKIDLRDRMGLLLLCCKDCIGAISVVENKILDDE